MEVKVRGSLSCVVSSGVDSWNVELFGCLVSIAVFDRQMIHLKRPPYSIDKLKGKVRH